MPDRPKVVCLCGSTRFKQQFIEANYSETMEGKIVLSVGFFCHADAAVHPITPEEKRKVDELHLRKIDMADEALILNVPMPYCRNCHKFQLDLDLYRQGSRCPDCQLFEMSVRPYIGESTRNEINYATAQGKPVRYQYPPEEVRLG